MRTKHRLDSVCRLCSMIERDAREVMVDNVRLDNAVK